MFAAVGNISKLQNEWLKQVTYYCQEYRGLNTNVPTTFEKQSKNTAIRQISNIRALGMDNLQTNAFGLK